MCKNANTLVCGFSLLNGFSMMEADLNFPQALLSSKKEKEKEKKKKKMFENHVV